MAWTNQTRIFGPFKHWQRPGSLLVEAGTGSVILEASGDGTSWITADSFTADAMKAVELSNVRALRLSVTGNARYSFSVT